MANIDLKPCPFCGGDVHGCVITPDDFCSFGERKE